MRLEDLFGQVPHVSLSELDASDRLVDVRTSDEFETDALPGARNVPLFPQEERRAVGHMYRTMGVAAAQGFGFERVSTRLEEFKRELCQALELPAADDGARRVIYCARGGMRSQAVTAFLRMAGHDVVQLEGGYRSYRRHVQATLAHQRIPAPVALRGLTGSAKTAILRAVARRYPRRVLDLEGYAGHRSSVLGDIGESPVAQKQFESRLARAVVQLEGPWTLTEWEARRLGNIQMPTSVYETLRDGYHLLLDVPTERRIRHLAQMYAPEGDVQALRDRLPKLAAYPKLGESGVAAIDAHLAARDLESAARILLERHYDPRYQNGTSEAEVNESWSIDDEPERIADKLISWLNERSGA